jgi:DNA (cytosine-5)-methyltransferase 1
MEIIEPCNRGVFVLGTVVDLFAGCGGLSLGLEQAGFETVFVNELHPVAMQTYLENRPDTNLSSAKNHAFDILSLTQKPAELEALSRRLRKEHGEIDLVVGGPPCQGFSGIGHRRSFDLAKEDIPSNHLYREMARVVEAVAPRAFIFENVRGLLNSRWTPQGEKGEIWETVQQTFRDLEVRKGRRLLRYSIRAQLVFAKDYGVAQNRPRIIMVGIREDVLPSILPVGLANGYIPAPLHGAPDLVDLLGDLVDPNWIPGGRTEKYLVVPQNKTQERMRRTRDGKIMRKGSALTDQEYGNHSPEIIEKFLYMLENDGAIPEAMQTKKFAQRVMPTHWGAKGPTITATSLAVDYVHFSQPRVPTVREWARLQSFPDWYSFAGRRTTGGRRRAGDPDAGIWTRDLPKYTQIGNAVPVDLGWALGNHLKAILN